MRRLFVYPVVPLLAAGLALITAPASASPQQLAGSEFGQHVALCAQTMDFDSVHNPGMHQGYHGWDGTPC